ncbi:ABC transporter ATP-binding protein [Lysinibacillus sp. FSL H8-0500]|uniref:ABC transporter ATP-binding protein n=1 Tax=Lysinibacillus macroides TaxID=33935 RepID=A0A0N0UX48_9BACI|nr:ABC transporter ATP-binding protein [Lysinibacillus macroides]KOY83257.1 ABC transporter ATP-binding protein [Lysinibacillus macroides]QPR69118.1 ABC transporter ATP-binding protein [Lysinibacillus macroides]
MVNSQIVLSVEKISKIYESAESNVHALKNICFQLRKGEMLAIMGTSGSGKSTLLNILGALDQPSSGKIKLNGIDSNDIFDEPRATDYRRENIGFIFQNFNLLKDLSVAENITLPLILQKYNSKEIEQKVNEMIELMGLTKWKNHRPVELSGGQQQRVAIGRAIITTPPIILADELTGNLDFNTSTEVLKVLVDMKKQFTQSILLVTHDPLVATYADRVLFFHDGQIIDEYHCSGTGDIEEIMGKFQNILGKKSV